MLALPPKFLQQLENADRQPFALLQINSTGIIDEATSEAEWGANTSESNVDYTPTPPESGDVILAVDTGENTTSAAYPDSDVTNEFDSGNWDSVNSPESDATYLNHNTVGSVVITFFGTYETIDDIPDNASIKQITITVRAVEDTNNVDVYIGYKYGGTTYWDGGHALTGSFADYTYDVTVNPVTSNPWLKEEILTISEIGCKMDFPAISAGRVSVIKMEVVYYDFQTSGYIETEYDLSASTSGNEAILSIDDYAPDNTSITYTAEGSATGAWGGEEVALGSVQDGSILTNYAYYRILATFASDASATPILKSIVIEIPDNIYKYSTLSDGTLNALPWLKDIPGRTISISLKDFITTTSGLSVELVRNETVDEMIRGNNFRGLDTTIKIGMYTDDIVDGDLFLYYSGTVLNYALSEDIVSIKLSDSTKDLSVKVPEGTAPSTAVSQSYTSAGTYNMIDVILDLIDKASVKTRYIDQASFATVKANVGDGTPAAANFVIYRGSSPPEDPGATWDTTIVKADTAKTVISELLELLGAYIVVHENGRLTCIEYDSSTAAEETWDDDVIFKGASYDPGLEALRNQVYVYYDWDGLGTQESNFHSIYIVADATSAADWNTVATKIILSKWLAGDSTDGYYGDDLAAHIADRETTRLKDGVGTFECETSLDKCHIQVGDFITIDSALIINPDVGYESTRKFMVTQKTWNISGGRMSWQLTEAR